VCTRQPLRLNNSSEFAKALRCKKSRPVRNVSGELSLVFSFNKHERRLRTINFIQGDSSEIMLKAEAHVVFFFGAVGRYNVE
jgi:hypothetical protein